MRFFIVSGGEGPLKSRPSFRRIVLTAAVGALASIGFADAKTPVDWVNPEMGNISHLLVPCYPTVQRPNAMMRFLPPNGNYVTDLVGGFSLGVFAHRTRGAGGFGLQPYCGPADGIGREWTSSYDQAHAKPYRYDVYLDDFATRADYVPAEKSAVFSFTFEKPGTRALIFGCHAAKSATLEWKDKALVGVDAYRELPIYLFAEFDAPVLRTERHGRRFALVFADDVRTVRMRYAFSLISTDQARANLRAEIADFDPERLAAEGRAAWNETLGQIRVEGGSDDQKAVFYTSLWRCYERMIDFTEAGRYRGWDRQVHEAGPARYYSDDWVWDTYRAHHPLMVLLRPREEGDKLSSYIRFAEQNPEGWVPTFPTIAGDAHSMNGQHFIAPFLDAWRKGVRNFDLKAAYAACVKTVRESTKTPWVRGPKNELDAFYDAHGYFPGLNEGEKETVSAVMEREKRQCVAVTLAASYDAWCLSEIARELGDEEGVREFKAQSENYRKLWKSDTQFFHPKDKDGKWIEPFDYKFSGGRGSRDYYDENNAWTYVWGVPHDIPSLIGLFGGEKPFVARLDRLFREPLGCRTYLWPSKQPDSSAMMGQFSMGNEPSFHIPYLYALAGAPHKTQKRIRRILSAWFRNDLMGVPGDEDGGGMSAFVVFSMLGLYPITPGLPQYVIGSPVFTRAEIRLQNGRTLVISAPDSTADAKYVRRVTVGGAELKGVMIPHADLLSGREVLFEMADRPPAPSQRQRL